MKQQQQRTQYTAGQKMPMNQTTPALTIRQLMPPGFLAELAKRTGLRNPSNLAQLVRMEQTTSRHWPAVLGLAKETNPEGFAQWESAQKDLAQAVTAAS
ncbi:hypothetical protein [Hymenobacter guriensis]|uniref:Uncharacterized protein n=1 Tax=Hymenobacter guriensis TaxID=2793065 RepID=A0ABS0L7R1_9BACT|nr:hypothetical protein [Hymenobacter guriensis]MBG8556188.1 hypothetical protein [Hymenobacter guriensis]